MAIGNEVNTPPFVGQRSCNNNGKNKTLASSGCGIIQFDRPVYFNSLPTPLSGEKGNPGQLAKRNVTTVQPSVRGELAQQSDSPSPIEICNKAKERLDASARDHRPWALITTDDQGRAQAILSNSLDQRFFRQIQQVFDNTTKLNSSLLQESEFNPGLFASGSSIAPRHRVEESYSSPTSRRPSSLDHSQGELGLVRVGKRGASTLDQDSSLEDDDQQCNVVPTVTLTLGAEDAILAFFTTTFKAIQQQALKQILKAWIKELEPHKQKHHPYKGKVLPPYWPEQISFVEPDHQRTEDRVAVAIYIIQFVQKDPKWTDTGIDTLEMSTNSIKLQFDDEPQEKFHKRKILLQQLYDVARQQSRFMKNERDGDEPIAFQDPMETMRIKRQPRVKRQKTTRETSQTCEPSPISLSESPDLATDSQFTTSSVAVSPTSATPMNELCPQYAPQFHSEPEQSLATSQHTNAPQWNASNFDQHRANNPQWSASNFNHAGNMHHGLPYSVPPHSQQSFPFTLPECTPSVGQASASASFDSSPVAMQYYSTQTPSPSQLNFNTISLSHGLGPLSDIKMASSQPTSAYPSVWPEEQRWDPTPASYPQY